ncbi:MAG: Maf family protein [Proteobacteria bacterium]|nr:Maf family protein [Pseudomonadota bacterium]
MLRSLDPPLVLASRSPRRRELLAGAGVPLEIRAADIAEDAQPGESPEATALRLASEKALAVSDALEPGTRRWVLGADTLVILDDVLLGKPRDAAHAVEMLSRLVGRQHRVVTGVALVDSRTRAVRAISVETRVVMRPAARDEIRAYVATGEPLDKAGAYAIQGGGRRFIEQVEGSETNVIGLPLEETLDLMRATLAAKSAEADP